MGETRDRYRNEQMAKRRGADASCFRRAGVLLLCLLIWITSAPCMVDAFTVHAEEENNLRCVITAFSPLPEEIARQIVSVGTPVEELQLPDTLAVVCTYEEDTEDASNTEKEDSDEDGKTPDKPDVEDGDKVPTEPETGDNIADKPAEDDPASEKPEESGQTPETSDVGDQTPDKPEQGEAAAEKPAEGGSAPEKPKESGQTPETPNVGDQMPDKPEQGGQTPTAPEEAGLGASDPSDENNSAVNVDAGDVAASAGDPADTAVDGMSDAESTVYVDKLDEMLSAARDKMVSFLGGVSVEETQVTMESNLTEPDRDSEVQILTNMVSISPVTWESVFAYDSGLAGCYIFTPVLPEDDIVLADDAVLPEIVVIVAEEKAEAKAVQARKIRVMADTPADNKCGDNLTWKYENGTLTICGTGDMYGFDKAPWSEYASSISNVIIESGATSIGNFAFFDCKSLTSVAMPASIQSIGAAAFYGCSALKTLTIPKSVAKIGNLAFNGCSGLGEVEIPSSVVSITEYAFRDCTNAYIFYPASLSGMGGTKGTSANVEYTFSSGLTTLTIISLGSGINAIHFPATVGGGTVAAANWIEHEDVEITHASFPDHRYTDSSECTICGHQKELVVEETPEAGIDYIDECLINLTPGVVYRIGINGTTGAEMTAGADGSIPFPQDESWFGRMLSIIKIGKSPDSTDSGSQSLQIPTRPSAPEKSSVSTTPATAGKSDGTIVAVSTYKDKMQYSMSGKKAWSNIAGITQGNLAAGKYDVRFRADNTARKFASESLTVTIASAAIGKEPTPTASINFLTERLTGLQTGDQYLINGEAVTVEKDGVRIQEAWFGTEISIVKAGDGVTFSDSDAQLLQIPARPPKPTQVEGQAVSAKGAKDGKLQHVDNTMEYQADGAAGWTKVTADQVVNLPAGIYFVRIRATASGFCSEDVEVTIMDRDPDREQRSSAEIDYEKEELTDLNPGAAYLISVGSAASAAVTVKADAKGRIAIQTKWFGSDLYIVKKGNGFSIINSDAQLLSVPARPNAPEHVVPVHESKKGGKDGKLTNLDSSMAYQKKGAADWTPIAGTEVTKLSPGIYLVCYQAVAGQKFCSESAEYRVDAYELIREELPDAVISYESECFMYLTVNAYYKISGVKVQANDGGTIPIRAAWMTGKEISIVKAGDGVTTSDSAKQSIVVPKRPSAPASVKAVSESAEGAKDGKLTGVNGTMAYRVAGANDWTPIYGDTVEPLEPAKYEICYMATDHSFVSAVATRIVYAFGAEPKQPLTSKDSDSEEKDSDEEEQNAADGNDSSGDGQGGGSQTGNAVSASPAGGKHLTAAADQVSVQESAADGNKYKRNNEYRSTEYKQNAVSGNSVEVDGDQDSGKHKGNAIQSTEKSDGDGDSGGGSDNGSLTKMEEGIHKDSVSVVYTERAADRAITFYDFLLRLADSRNLIWVAVILAEPIIFLLLLMYALGRKRRDEECQAEH